MNKLLVPILATAVGCSPFEVRTLRAQDWGVNELHYKDENVGYMRWEVRRNIDVKVGQISSMFDLTRDQFVDSVVNPVADVWQPSLEGFNINLNVDEGDRSYGDTDCRELFDDDSIVEDGDIVICVSDEDRKIAFDGSDSEVGGEAKPIVYTDVFDPDRFIYGSVIRLPYNCSSVPVDDPLGLNVVRELLSHEIGHSLGLKHPLNENTLMSEYGIFAADDAYIPQPDTEIHGINCVYTDGCGDEILEEEATE